MTLTRRDHKTRAQYRREVERFAKWLAAQTQLLRLASEQKVEAYLTYRARAGCAASTQNVAFHALRCFYARGLGTALQGIDALRVSEPLNARIKDLDFEHSQFTVRDGKHGVSRRVAIPCSIMPRLRVQVEIARLLHKQDVANGVPVPLPGLLAGKYRSAPFAWSWAWLFPAKAPCRFEGFPGPVRWRIHEANIQRAFKAAVRAAGLGEDITPHHLRHAWATHMAHRPCVTLRDIQVALGHKNLETTAGYVTPEIERLPDALAALIDLPKARAPIASWVR